MSDKIEEQLLPDRGLLDDHSEDVHPSVQESGNCTTEQSMEENIYNTEVHMATASTVRRDRRVRLSDTAAIALQNLQERLRVRHPSAAVEWLLHHAAHEIRKLPPSFPKYQTVSATGNPSSAAERMHVRTMTESITDNSGCKLQRNEMPSVRSTVYNRDLVCDTQGSGSWLPYNGPRPLHIPSQHPPLPWLAQRPVLARGPFPYPWRPFGPSLQPMAHPYLHPDNTAQNYERNLNARCEPLYPAEAERLDPCLPEIGPTNYPLNWELDPSVPHPQQPVSPLSIHGFDEQSPDRAPYSAEGQEERTIPWGGGGEIQPQPVCMLNCERGLQQERSGPPSGRYSPSQHYTHEEILEMLDEQRQKYGFREQERMRVDGYQSRYYGRTDAPAKRMRYQD